MQNPVLKKKKIQVHTRSLCEFIFLSHRGIKHDIATKPKCRNVCFQNFTEIKNKSIGLRSWTLLYNPFAISHFPNSSVASSELCYRIILPGDISGLLHYTNIPSLGYEVENAVKYEQWNSLHSPSKIPCHLEIKPR